MTQPNSPPNRPSTEPSHTPDEPLSTDAAGTPSTPAHAATSARAPTSPDARSPAYAHSIAGAALRGPRLPFVRQEIVGGIGARCDVPGKLPRATTDLPASLSRDPAIEPPPAAPVVRPPVIPEGARVRARGTPAHDLAPGEAIRTLVFAREPARLAWIDRELSHPPITIQVARRVRTVIAALLKDPPPRPQVLVVDFDAVSPPELLELHAIRQEGWFGRLIGVGHVPPELCASLGVDHVFNEPLVRDSLLDCVAGTRHATVTSACPVIPRWDKTS